MQDNVYWLGLLTHLQSDHVPGKTLEVLRDLIHMYEAATVEDIYEAVAEFNLGDDNVYTCIGVSGKQPPALAPFAEQNAGNLLSMPSDKRSPKGLWGSNGSNKLPSLNPRESANAIIAAFQAAAQNGQLTNHSNQD